MDKIKVLEKEIGIYRIKNEDYICITDIAKYKDFTRSSQILQNWLRNRNTLEFLGIWEKLNNPNFKHLEFEVFKKQAGLNSFVLTPGRWIEKTKAIGISTKSGRYGGTYAHKDIAFEFASWISVEFKLYLIKEFQRLKEEENKRKNLDWDLRRNLAKINYDIHTDAIRKNLIPRKISKSEEQRIYANEADILNMALFGMTAKEWKEKNPKKGNLRDHANASQLVCLSNLENLNSLFIKEKMDQKERLIKLNNIARSQMKILIQSKTRLKIQPPRIRGV